MSSNSRWERVGQSMKIDVAQRGSPTLQDFVPVTEEALARLYHGGPLSSEELLHRV